MSGHSKWSTIKRKKEATDQKRSKMFAKLLRAIEVASREGGGNVEANMTLASAVEKASAPDEETLLDIALEAGADDLVDQESHWEIITEPSGFKVVSDALREAGVNVVSAEITMQPTVTV